MQQTGGVVHDCPHVATELASRVHFASAAALLRETLAEFSTIAITPAHHAGTLNTWDLSGEPLRLEMGEFDRLHPPNHNGTRVGCSSSLKCVRGSWWLVVPAPGLTRAAASIALRAAARLLPSTKFADTCRRTEDMSMLRFNMDRPTRSRSRRAMDPF